MRAFCLERDKTIRAIEKTSRAAMLWTFGLGRMLWYLGEGAVPVTNLFVKHRHSAALESVAAIRYERDPQQYRKRAIPSGVGFP